MVCIDVNLQDSVKCMVISVIFPSTARQRSFTTMVEETSNNTRKGPGSLLEY